MAKRRLAQLVAMGTTRMSARTREEGYYWLSVRWGVLRLALKLYLVRHRFDFTTRAWLRCRSCGLDNRDTALILDALEDRAP